MAVNIIKGGLRQQVSQEVFDNLYKPNGWVVDDAGIKEAKDEIQETVKTLKSEGEIKNFIKMKKYEPRRFDDKLFKSEGDAR